MNPQYSTHSIQRIGLLLKREWTLQHRSLLKASLVLLLVLWGVRLLPLIFGKDYSEWAEGLRYDPLLISNTFASLGGLFITYLVWLNKTVHKSQTEPYTLIPSSVGEKYATFFIIALFYIVLALFIGLFSSTTLALLAPGCLENQFADWGRFFANISVNSGKIPRFWGGVFYIISYLLLSFSTYMVSQIFFSKAITGILVATLFLIIVPSMSPIIFTTSEVFSSETALLLFLLFNLFLSILFLFLGYHILKRKQIK
ncbi:hypothetical protein [Porphyromonas gingivicanis]|uniref:hypothetical protein n=1 Tax=Porphyromonas gingivicanis TaxID=266762 RepID=UPI000471E55B|nr:hypothetical protein [Porphyromonas gingivicanis]